MNIIIQHIHFFLNILLHWATKIIFFFTHTKLKLFSKIEKCNTSVSFRDIKSFVFLRTFEVLCTFEQVISAMQDGILQLFENHVF